MRSIARILAFVLMGVLLSLPVLGADDKDKKPDAKKEEPAKKTDVKKDDAKKDETAKKTDSKKDDSKKESDKGKDAPPAEKLFKYGTARGKIVWIDESKKKLKIQVQVGNEKVDSELQSIDDVKVRSVYPPMQFDEKGRARKPTAKELKELRGTDKLPGYQAEFSDLKMEQIVDVTLVTKKRPPRTLPKKGTLGEEYTPKMSVIIILSPLNP
jgi:hypothetical protein